MRKVSKNVRQLLIRWEILAPEICQLIDGLKDSSTWTEWDQSVRDRITELMKRSNAMDFEQHRLQQKRRREADREGYNAYQRNYSSRWYHLKSRYGMTEDEYQEVLKTQDGRCVICKRYPPLTKRGNVSSLHVDHNHVTNQRRGLVCFACNVGIGWVESAYYQTICEYLEYWGSVELAQSGESK